MWLSSDETTLWLKLCYILCYIVIYLVDIWYIVCTHCYKPVLLCDSYNLKCPINGCTWLLRSSCMGASRMFKTRKFIDIHTCPVKGRLMCKMQLKNGVLGTMYKCNDPRKNYTPTNIHKDTKRQHMITLSYMQAWRGRQKAFGVLRGDPSLSYEKIPIHLYMLEKHIQ